jgi:hypothetical protein
VFTHDDVHLSDYYWAQHLLEGLREFDIVGIAGNRRRAPRQAFWMYLNDRFQRDEDQNLSGVLGHGEGFPNLKELSIYGEPCQECKLLDGVLLAVRSQTLIEHDLWFDPRFKFDFYDLDLPAGGRTGFNHGHLGAVYHPRERGAVGIAVMAGGLR